MPKITVFSTPVCKYCKQLKEFLDSNHYEYTEINVAENKQELERMMTLSGSRGVPVTLIEHEDGTRDVIKGFQDQEIVLAVGM